ncbi:MAG: GatB/YqeY domain-containing protein [Bacteroidales bacterium]|nr:GatB/YqeY domain-containing protein [Bacteroidales bacterium]
MALEQQIQKDIMAAMKAHDYERTNAVRAIKSAILLAKTAEGGKKELEDADIIKLIQKLIKQRKEAAEQYTAAGRQELADNELAEAKILEEYVPRQLSPEEIEVRVREIIAQTGASAPSDMGKVMGVASRQLAGLADGRTLSTIVRQLLSQA